MPTQSRYPATWISQTYPVAYRLMPKCACSTIGQWIHYLDHGHFYPGLVHDHKAPILKWGMPDSRPKIIQKLEKHDYLFFAIARNPYSRVVSAFADKIMGYQRNGRHYRGGELHRHLERYGFIFGPDSNILDNFKIFVRFIVDTIHGNGPMPADPHWRPCATMLRVNARSNSNWLPSYFGNVEHLIQDLDTIADRAAIPSAVRPAWLPRDNTTSLGQVTIEQLYSAEELALVRSAYEEDFEWFGYGPHPTEVRPCTTIDADAVRTALRFEPPALAVSEEPEVAS